MVIVAFILPVALYFIIHSLPLYLFHIYFQC